MLQDVPVDAGFLCDEAAVGGDTINGTPVFPHFSHTQLRRTTNSKYAYTTPPPRLPLLHLVPILIFRLREEHRLRVFENRVLRRIFGPKRDEATGDWRRLHNEELNDLYSSPNIIRVIKSR
jgi:hypothetical protein